MKLSGPILLLSALLICGCQGLGNEQIPVTLQLKPAVSPTGDLSADKAAAVKTFRRLLDEPASHHYMDQVLQAIGQRTATLDNSTFPDVAFDLRLKIYEDGRIGGITIYGATNIPPAYIEAIKECSPFPQWPKEMHTLVGGTYWIMYISTGFNSPVPAPN